ncbi:hypothetical protein G5V59_16655 [Nocardioides sp. W3-2-3]|uniref:hypothetical protein n=1 Tax=Nocardioides convexus TaxID=2712224 RepID=UPI00241849C4|nr:hypothetical protein [Nocardioides convexus]NHA00974.1 hypothetical protein [Nocardioides convexus]
MSAMADQVSQRLIDQRLRNRVIEAVEIVAEGDRGVLAVGDTEYFNFFFDFIDDDLPRAWRSLSTYTAEEVSALEDVLASMLAALEATSGMDHLQMIASGWPSKIQPVAQRAHALMLSRGRFNEESEEELPSG